MAAFNFNCLRSFDVETFGKGELFGLQPWRIRDKTLRIRSYAFSYLLNGKMVQIPVPETSDGGVDRKALSDMLMQCAERGDYLVTWNGTYDIACLLAFGMHKECQSIKWLDGMLLWARVETQRKKYGLKPFVDENIPSMSGYAEDIDHSIEVPIKQLMKYNCQDTDATLFGAIKFINQLTDKEMNGALIESEDMYDIALANMQGILLDFGAIKELMIYLQKQEADAKEALKPHMPPGVVFKDEQNPKGLSVLGKGLPDLLYNHWGLPILKMTDGGKSGIKKPSTDKATLLQLALQDPRARQIIEIRQAQNRMSKYVKSAVDSATYHNTANGYQDIYGIGHIKCFITRPQCKKSSTYTGRNTYGSKIRKKGHKEIKIGIALHQMKREKIFRKMIIPPPGFMLVEHDFSGQEMRLMAELSKDPTMLKLFLDNIDGHSYMGARVTCLSYDRIVTDMAKGDDDEEFQHTQEYKDSKGARYLGKFLNLSLQFRIGAKSLRIKALADYDMVITMAESQHYIDIYKKTFPGVPVYWQNQIELARRQGYVETLGGRRVYFKPESWQGNSWAAESTSINFPVQGSAGCQKSLAMKYLTRYYREHAGSRFAFELHDGLFSYFKIETANQDAHKVEKILSNLPYEEEWGYKPTLSFPVDAAIGKSWGEMKGLIEE